MATNRTPGATAEVLVDSKRRGTAVLVDQDHLLTAYHNLVSAGNVSPTKLIVRFPQSQTQFDVTLLPSAGAATDLAILRMTGVDPSALPAPVDLWPDDRPPAAVAVFGYPQAERIAEGVWRAFEVAGNTASGLWQLRWTEDIGTFVGHSGGPVVDLHSGQLAGILLAGSTPGRFDRFVAIPEISAAWPALRRPWRYAGESARSHFFRRARGQRSRTQGGDLFHGRSAALLAIKDWLGETSPGRPLTIIGQPGSGKSAVLGRATLQIEATDRRGIAYHARGSSVDDFLETVASFLGLDTPAGIDDLLDQIARQDRTPPVALMIDALDEARTISDVHSIGDAVAELARLPAFHAVVATRPLATGNRFGPGSVMSRLMTFTETARNLIDLDVAPFRDRAAIEAFVDAMLAQRDADNPGPANCAWQMYRSDNELRKGLSKVIADRSDPNFLVAAITSMALSTQDVALDHRDPDFTPESIPSNLGEALEKYYSSLDLATRKQVTGLLAALAHARGSGVSDARWLTFTENLGYPAGQADLDAFRTSPGADYLLQTEDADGNYTFRLFHQALIDQLRVHRPNSDARKIYESLRAEVEAAGGWSAADDYLTSHIADHAYDCHQIPVLLNDLDYVAVADIPNLLAALDRVDLLECPEIGQLILQEGTRLGDLPPADRLSLLAFASAHAGERGLQEGLLARAKPGLRPLWAHPLGTRYQKLVGHTSTVRALTAGRLGFRDVIVAGGSNGFVYVWDHRGSLLFDPLPASDTPITALSIGILDGEQLLLSGSADGSVQLWDENGILVGRPFLGHTRAVTAIRAFKFDGDDAVLSVAPKGEMLVRNPEGLLLRRFPIAARHAVIGQLKDGLTVVTAGFFTVSLFSPVDGYSHSIRVTKSPKTALAVGRLGNADVVLCGLRDGSIAAWREDGGAAAQPLIYEEHHSAAQSISAGRLGGTDVIAATSRDDSLLIWDFRGRLLASPWTGHPGTASVVAIESLRGRDLITCAGDDRTVRVWDNRTLLARGRTNTRGQIDALAAREVDGQLEITTVSSAGMTVWGSDGELVSEIRPTAGWRNVTVSAVASVMDQHLVVTAGKDRVIRIWSTAGECLGSMESGTRRKIQAVSVGSHDGRTIVVWASRDQMIYVWDRDAVDRYPTGSKTGSRAISFGSFNGQDCVLVLGTDNLIRGFDLETRSWFHVPPLPTEKATCAMTAKIAGCDLLIAGRSDGAIATWQSGQERFRISQDHHNDAVTSLAVGEAKGIPVVVSTGADSTLRIWFDLKDSVDFALPEPASQIAISGSQLIAATGPALSLFRYDPATTPGRNVANDEYSFTGDSELTDLPDALRDRDPETGGPRKATMDEFHAMRTLLTPQDSAGEVVEQILPRFSKLPAGVGFAADTAYLSADNKLLNVVLPYLRTARMMRRPDIQGRRFAIAIMLDRLDEAAEASIAIGDDCEKAITGMIRLLDRDADHSREWVIYRRVALALKQGDLSIDDGFAREVSLVSAMRLLATCRGGADDPDSEGFAHARDVRLEEYWTWYDDEVEFRLADLITGYLANPVNEDNPRAYQIISIHEVLCAVTPDDPTRRRLLANAVAQQLHASPEYVRSDFAAWARYSALADAAVRLDP